MGVNSLLAIVVVGLFLLCLGCLATVVFIVARFTSGETVTPQPSKKLFVRAGKSVATPDLVGSPKVVTSTVPAGGPDGVTHIDATKKEEYIGLDQVPKNELAQAVDKYLRGEGSAQAAIAETIEGEV